MKRIALFLAVVVAAIACNNEEAIVPEVTVKTAEADLVLPQAGDEVWVEFTSNVDWKAALKEAEAADFWSITPKSGLAGDGKIRVTVYENDTNENRTATLVITADTAVKEVVLTQLQKNALVAGATALTVGAEGGEVKFNLAHNVDYQVAVDADWLTATKAMTNTELVFTAAANTALEARTATITITAGDLSQTVTVTQDAFVPSFEMDKAEIWLPVEGGSGELNITANFDYEVSVDSDWLTMTNEGGKYTFTATANADFYYRAVEVMIEGWSSEENKFYVFQNGRAEAAWIKKASELGFTLASGTTRMALKDNYVLLANGGSSILALNAADGTVANVITLPDGFVATSLANDDAGNVVIAADAAAGASTNVYYVSSLDVSTAKLLCTLTNDVVRDTPIDAWGTPTTTGTAGNLRVSGDVTGDAVLTMGIGLIEQYIACEIKGGVAQPQISGKLPEFDKLVNSHNNMVVYPLGASIADGVVNTGYTLTYSVYYSTDMVDWTSIIPGDAYANGNDSPNAMAFAKVNGKDYLAIGIGCHFTWTQARVVVYDITDKAAAKKVGTWNLPESSSYYVGTTGPNCDVAIVPGEGDSFTLYYFGGASEMVAKINVK